jgi:FG-GAP repeat.
MRALQAFCCLVGFFVVTTAGNPGLTPAWIGEGNQANGAYGHAVASAGDVNGDGFDDVIVGMPKWDSVQVDEGRAIVYLGSVTGLSSSAAWVLHPGDDLDPVLRAGRHRLCRVRRHPGRLHEPHPHDVQHRREQRRRVLSAFG